MGNYVVPDNFLQRGDWKLEENVVNAINLCDVRTHDALATNLPGTAANDDMALITGTPGTNAPTLQGVDFGGATSDEKCAFLFPVPIEYVSGETITIRCHAGMLTTIADTSCTLDCEVWSDDGDGTVSSDLCATAAQDINSLTLADIDFSITATSVSPGDILIVRLSFAGTDSGNAGVMIPTITKISVLMDMRG